MEKVYEKMCGQKYTKTEIVDEADDVEVEEVAGLEHGEVQI